MMMIALKKGWGFIQLVCVAAADVCMPAGAPGLNFLFLKTGRLSCVITIGKKHTISTSLKSWASEFFIDDFLRGWGVMNRHSHQIWPV